MAKSPSQGNIDANSIDPETVNNRISRKIIHTASGCDLCVPGHINDLVSYVLMEQETWFEPELEFITRAARGFRRVIDISALYGIYALPVSRQVDKVFVIETSPVTTHYLQQTLEANHIDNVSIISRQTGSGRDGDNSRPGKFSLDDYAKSCSLDNIDLLIINLGGSENGVLENADNFLRDNAPLIMCRRHHDMDTTSDMVKLLARQGYYCFYLIPGLQLLAPVEDIAIVESTNTSLFFCKESTLDKLYEQGILCTGFMELNDELTKQQLLSVYTEIDKLPYARQMSPHWSKRGAAQIATEADSGDCYLHALYFWFRSRNPGHEANERVASLMTAFNILSRSLEFSVDFPKLMTLARITSDLGLTATALQALKTLLEMFCSTSNMHPDKPFLSPQGAFEKCDPEDHLGEWSFSAVLQAFLWQKAYSSYFMEQEDLAALQGLKGDRFIQPRTERARQLLAMKLGQQKAPESHSVLAERSDDNLNHTLWNRTG